MTKKIIKTIFFLIFLSISFDNFAQTGTIFFSITGDTVCYSDFLSAGDDKYSTFIKTHHKDGELKTISSFLLKCEASNTCLQSLSKDTIKKYHLKLDGDNGVWGAKSDFSISIKPTNTKQIDTSAFGPKFIYQSTIKADIYCKGKKLYSKNFEVMFKGNTPSDFRQFDFVTINAWRKKNTKKYYVDIHVKEYQIFKKPGDAPDYTFKHYQFLL